MHDVVEGELKLAANHTHALVKSAAPAVSPYWSAKLWLTPEPDAGVTKSAVRTAAAGAGTVHAPRVCHPLVIPAAVAAYMNTLLAPLNEAAKLTGRLNVSVLPLVTTVVLTSETEH